jgi:rod shape-determining protein MreC
VFKAKKKVLTFWIILCVLILLPFLSIPAIRAPFLNTIKQPLNLLTLIRREVGAVIFYHRNFTQNTRLREEIDFLRNKVNACQENYLENTRLKELLSLKKQSSFKLIAAKVIARSPDSWSSVVIIDKGRFNGIKRGMVAINYLGLLGRVIEAGESTSKILLINDHNLSISAIVQRSRQEGLVSGTLGHNLIMKYLPEDCDIRFEDTVITSGLNQTYPKGLLIGTVTYIGKEFSGLSRYCLIKPAVNLSSIEEVLIIM